MLQKNYHKSIDYFKEIIQVENDCHKAHFRLGIAYHLRYKDQVNEIKPLQQVYASKAVLLDSHRQKSKILQSRSKTDDATDDEMAFQ